MSPKSVENHYATLGVPFDATQKEIRRAYHAAAKRLHPDRNPSTDARDMFLRIQAAFETLSDPQSRAQYDRSIGPIEPVEGFDIQVLLSRTRLPRSTEPQLLYAMLKLTPAAQEEDRSGRPALNVCLVIDTSTSMQGQRMDMVKITARRILNQLQPSDVFSVVTFSDRAEVVIEASRTRDENKLASRISLIQTGGGTEMFYGLQEGFRQLKRYQRSAHINHMILITDGQTYGDEKKCLRLAGDIKESGVTLSALGIGQEWNESFLDRLAGRTGGSSIYIAYARDIKRFLENHFDGLQDIYAENVRIEVDAQSEKTELVYVFRAQPDPTRLEIDEVVAAGNLKFREHMVILLEMRIDATPDESDHLQPLSGRLHYQVTGRSVPAGRIPFSIEIPVSEEIAPENPPAELVEAMSRLTLYRMQEQVRADLEAGQFEAATRRLRHMATHVLASGDHDLGSTILSEAARLESGARRTRRLEKAIMYGTKALISEKASRTLRSDSL